MNKIFRVLKILLDYRVLKFALTIKTGGYLKDIGWIDSFKKRKAQSSEGEALPWVTYSFIEFIDKRIKKDMVMFEFGSGSSTEYYSKRVKKLISVEHDREWYEAVKDRVGSNVELKHIRIESGGKYCKSAKLSQMKYDLIIVDGRDRVNCMKYSIGSLKQGGVIVLDDSERKKYKEGIDFAISKGFKKIDFWGISPGSFHNKATTIFYKTTNCLEV